MSDRPAWWFLLIGGVLGCTPPGQALVAALHELAHAAAVQSAGGTLREVDLRPGGAAVRWVGARDAWVLPWGYLAPLWCGAGLAPSAVRWRSGIGALLLVGGVFDLLVDALFGGPMGDLARATDRWGGSPHGWGLLALVVGMVPIWGRGALGWWARRSS